MYLGKGSDSVYSLKYRGFFRYQCVTISFWRASNTLENSLKYVKVSMRPLYPIIQFESTHSEIPIWHIYICTLKVTITIVLNFLLWELWLKPEWNHNSESPSIAIRLPSGL